MKLSLSAPNRRRWQIFKAHRRGFWCLWIFIVLFMTSLLANVLVNDRPFLVYYKGAFLFPTFIDYPEEKFGGFLARTNYRDQVNQDEIQANGWMLWPLLRYSYNTVNHEIPQPAPSKPAFLLDKDQACIKYPLKAQDPNCRFGNMNWLGTDDQGRDLIARILYGFRISILFGFALTFFSALIGVWAGAVQGYFGGWIDLLFQRFIDIWSSIPILYLLIILAQFFTPNFWWLLAIMLLFSWMSFVGMVRAEFLRVRNFEYVRAARALGLSDIRIIIKHILPNALVSTVSFVPFILSGSLVTLASLDFLGFGLPPGSPSLGELITQGKQNLQAPWLGIAAFFVMSVLLALLVFIGEAVRDALDPRA